MIDPQDGHNDSFFCEICGIEKEFYFHPLMPLDSELESDHDSVWYICEVCKEDIKTNGFPCPTCNGTGRKHLVGDNVLVSCECKGFDSEDEAVYTPKQCNHEFEAKDRPDPNPPRKDING